MGLFLTVILERIDHDTQTLAVGDVESCTMGDQIAQSQDHAFRGSKFVVSDVVDKKSALIVLLLITQFLLLLLLCLFWAVRHFRVDDVDVCASFDEKLVDGFSLAQSVGRLRQFWRALPFQGY